MAESNAVSAFGSQLQIGDGGGTEVFTDIAEMKDISGPGGELGTVEVTHHQSPDATREYRPTLKDLSDVTFSTNFIPTEATQNLTTGLLADWKNRVKRNFRLIFADTGSTTWGFSAYVTSWSPSSEVENVHMCDFTLRPTGVITEV